ncbi:MAG TPA: hypothetical protein VK619_04920, partial [Pyrinomonadaceae bacterium]|nr:hypothetical protein [Pyrinomonadaceae bacterium]
VGLIGHKIAADVEAAGIKGVLTNAVYDTWWHGGFRTAPYYHNSVGILTEAASARIMTPATVTREQLERSSTRGMASALPQFPTTNFPDPWPGGTWHPRDIMRMEMIASRSVLSLAADYRSDYLRNFYELGRAGLREIPEGEPLGYLVPAGQGNDESVAKLIGTLVEQGVEVFRLDREMHALTGVQSLAIVDTRQASNGRPANERETASGLPRGISTTVRPMQEIPAGSYIIFLNQPYRSNVQTLFEPQLYPNRMTGSGEAERPYDVAGWTLPMQMGIDAPAVMKIRESVSERRLTPVRDENDVRRDLGLALRQGARSPIVNPVKGDVRVALYKSWTASMDEGWTRWLFDTFNVPYKSLLDEDVRRGQLRASYDVIILPSMRMKEIVEGNAAASYPREFTGGITEAGVENLRKFVEEGGTLICFDASTELAIKRFNLPLRNALEGVKSSDFYCPGSILRAVVDTSNPIARGMPQSADIYFINSLAFEVTDAQRVRVIASYAEDNVLRSGWLLGERRIAGKAALAEVTMGRGRVVLFAFRPQHRGQTWGTFPFIFNAIMAGRQ